MRKLKSLLKPAPPNLFDIRDRFCGKQIFPQTRDGGEMRDWGRKFLPSPHAAGEMGQALEAVPRLRELVGRAAELRWGWGGWGERQTI